MSRQKDSSTIFDHQKNTLQSHEACMNKQFALIIDLKDPAFMASMFHQLQADLNKQVEIAMELQWSCPASFNRNPGWKASVATTKETWNDLPITLFYINNHFPKPSISNQDCASQINFHQKVSYVNHSFTTPTSTSIWSKAPHVFNSKRPQHWHMEAWRVVPTFTSTIPLWARS